MAADNQRYDFALDSEGDLLFSTAGDLVIAPSDTQHIEDCVIAGPAWWKQNPDRGVNIGIYQNGSFDNQTLERKVKLELLADGYKSTPAIKFNNGALVINTNVTL